MHCRPAGLRSRVRDYAAADLRSLAALSGDEVLISAFDKNEDVHALTASMVLKAAQGDRKGRAQHRQGKQLRHRLRCSAQRLRGLCAAELRDQPLRRPGLLNLRQVPERLPRRLRMAEPPH
ncbi:MAG: hypothetical protein IPL19_20415 [Sandaracinaceae bacterium]|nr:hypothetical protein [Sandaracinaceae bacterium]